MTFEGGFHPLNSFFRKKIRVSYFSTATTYPKISKIGGGGLPMFPCQLRS